LLILNAWQDQLWAQNITTDDTPLQVLSWLGAGLGLLMIAGIFVRTSAISVGVLYLISLLFVSPVNLLEHIEYLGLAAYLAAVGGGPLTIKRLQSYDLLSLEAYRNRAKDLLQKGVGLSLIILAFSEKLFAFGIAHQFLNNHHWNFLDFAVSNRLFIIIAGSFELLIGLALFFNLATRLVVLGVLGLFITTAILLGLDEVVGHLFAVGLLAVVWFNYPRTK
jgi:hypothetical protein